MLTINLTGLTESLLGIDIITVEGPDPDQFHQLDLIQGHVHDLLRIEEIELTGEVTGLSFITLFAGIMKKKWIKMILFEYQVCV